MRIMVSFDRFILRLIFIIAFYILAACIASPFVSVYRWHRDCVHTTYIYDGVYLVIVRRAVCVQVSIDFAVRLFLLARANAFENVAHSRALDDGVKDADDDDDDV